LRQISTTHLVRAVLAQQLTGRPIDGYPIEPVLAELELRHPTDPGVQFRRAQLQAKLGDVDAAVERLERVCRRRAVRSILFPASDEMWVAREAKEELGRLTRPRRIEEARRRAIADERQRAREATRQKRLQEERRAEYAADEKRQLELARQACRLQPGRPIFHTTHVTNLPAIVDSGRILCQHSAVPITPIGDDEIKRRRRSIPIGGGVTIGECVPFYFTPTTPMMHRVVKYMLPERNDTHENLVVLVGHTNVLIASGRECFVTDGNAATAATNRFELATEESVEEVPDWTAIHARCWDDEARRRWQAEFLVRSSVPLGYIDTLAVATQGASARVSDVLAAAPVSPEIKIEPRWFNF
jgi:hypothetical protein